MRLGAALAFLGLMVLAACGGSDGFERLETVPDECSQADGYPLADNVMIANEILGETSQSATFDATERNVLASRVQAVLDAVRIALPNANDVHAPPLDRWHLFVIPDDSLKQMVLAEGDTGTTTGGLVVKKTGVKELDDLNSQLGLLAMNFRWHKPSGSFYATVCLSDLVNTKVAAAEYTSLTSIEAAETSGLGGDSAALDMRERVNRPGFDGDSNH